MKKPQSNKQTNTGTSGQYSKQSEREKEALRSFWEGFCSFKRTLVTQRTKKSAQKLRCVTLMLAVLIASTASADVQIFFTSTGGVTLNFASSFMLSDLNSVTLSGVNTGNNTFVNEGSGGGYTGFYLTTYSNPNAWTSFGGIQNFANVITSVTGAGEGEMLTNVSSYVAESFYPNDTEVVTLQYGYPAPDVPCSSNIWVYCVNMDSQSHSFLFGKKSLSGDDEVPGSTGEQLVTLDGGQDHTFSATVPCAEAYLYGVWEIDYSGSIADGTATAVHRPIASTTSGAAPTSPGPTPPDPLPPVPPNTNAIPFGLVTNGIPNTNAVGVAVLGADALFHAIETASDQAHNDAQGLNTDLAGIGSLIASNHAAAATNGATESTQIASLGTLQGISNRLASATNRATESTALNQMGALMAISNGIAKITDTNGLTQTNQSLVVNPWATNSAAATAAAMGALGTTASTWDSAISFLSTPPDVGADPGDGGVFDFDMAGQHVNCDPVRMWPWAFLWANGVAKFALTVSFLWIVGRKYVQAAKFLGSLSTGGVPNMEVFGGGEALTFGGFFGGNFAGVLVYAIVPGVLLALFVIFITALIVPLDEFFGIYAAIGTLFSSVSSHPAGQAGVHILTNAFPVGYAIRITTAGLLLEFTMAKAAVIFAGASRYLAGK